MTKVQVVQKDVSCCGVLKQGWEGYVQLEIDVSDLGIQDSILVLDDMTVVWKSQTVEVQPNEH